MRLVSFTRHREGAPSVGALDADQIVDLGEAARLLPDETGGPSSASALASMRGLLSAGPDLLEVARHLVERSGHGGIARYPAASCRLLPPVPDPTKIICIGLNYGRVAKAVAYAPGEAPPIFHKAPSALVGHGDAIVLPALDIGPVAAEVELGVVIGARARHVQASRAFDVIAGYTVVIDVTANEMMRRDTYRFRGPDGVTPHAMFFRAKDYDTFAPTGPVLVTCDEVPDARVGCLALGAWADGEQFVDASTADMLVDVPAIVEAVSAVVTLEAGDLIATGHPGHLKPRALLPGETIEASIECVGTLRVSVDREEPT